MFGRVIVILMRILGGMDFRDPRFKQHDRVGRTLIFAILLLGILSSCERSASVSHGGDSAALDARQDMGRIVPARSEQEIANEILIGMSEGELLKRLGVPNLRRQSVAEPGLESLTYLILPAEAKQGIGGFVVVIKNKRVQRWDPIYIRTAH
jgi:hypothetical protein